MEDEWKEKMAMCVRLSYGELHLNHPPTALADFQCSISTNQSVAFRIWGGQGLKVRPRCLLRVWEWYAILKPRSVRFRSAENLSFRGNDGIVPTKPSSLFKKDRFRPEHYQVFKYEPVHPFFQWPYLSSNWTLASIYKSTRIWNPAGGHKLWCTNLGGGDFHDGREYVCLLYYFSHRLSSTLGSSLIQATPCIVLLASFVTSKIFDILPVMNSHSAQCLSVEFSHIFHGIFFPKKKKK